MTATDSPFMMAQESQLFAPGAQREREPKLFGWRYNGRYKMPLLPGEQGTKSGGDWVPYHVQSVTNLMDGFEDTRGLNLWEQEAMAAGLAMSTALREELVLLVQAGLTGGVDFTRLRDWPEYRALITGGWDRELIETSILGRAKQISGANEAREKGTHRHTAWEHWCKHRELIGTPEIREQISQMAALLEHNGLEIIPELSERTVRHTTLAVAGRFDNVLLNRATGRLLMADLKTKRRPFRSWAAVDGQLYCYASADWMLAETGTLEPPEYLPGPVHHVDQSVGVALVMPSDGSPMYLRRVNLEHGREYAEHARRTLTLRSRASSAERGRWGEWHA